MPNDDDHGPDKDPKDHKNRIRSFASELMSAMKQKASEPINLQDIHQDEPEELEAFDQKVPPAREKLLRVLEGDVAALGWDQPCKLWGVLVDSDSGEEYLKLITTLGDEPAKAITKMAKKGRAKEDVKGVVVSQEAWSYPDKLMDALSDDKEGLDAFCRVLPPHEHPEKIKRRAISMFNKDGSYACVSRNKSTDKVELIPLIDAKLVLPVANLLNMTPEEKEEEPPDIKKLFETIDKVTAAIKFVLKCNAVTKIEKDWDAKKKRIDELLKDVPDSMKKLVIDSMPDKLRERLGY